MIFYNVNMYHIHTAINKILHIVNCLSEGGGLYSVLFKSVIQLIKQWKCYRLQSVPLADPYTAP
jgi:hypothetical protein